MSGRKRKRPYEDSFFTCSECKRKCRTLQSVFDRCCPLEQEVSLNSQSLETFSDIDAGDSAESIRSIVCETSSAGVEIKCEKPDETRQIGYDVFEQPLLEPNSDGGKKDQNLTSDPTEKQSAESFLDELSERNNKIAPNASKGLFENSFFTCLHCKLKCPTLQSVFDHCCPLEQEVSSNSQSPETFSDIDSDDPEHVDSDDGAELVIVINEYESIRRTESETSSAEVEIKSNISEASSAGVETEYEKTSSETKSDETRQIGYDVLEKPLTESNSDGGKDDQNLTSDQLKSNQQSRFWMN